MRRDSCKSAPWFLSVPFAAVALTREDLPAFYDDTIIQAKQPVVVTGKKTLH